MTSKTLACISLITATQAASACTCAEIYDKQFINAFEHVVVATVIAKTTVDANRRSYKLAMQEVIKGDGKVVSVYTDTRSNCAANFRQGESYVIFTNAAPQNQISVCSSRLLIGSASKNEVYQEIKRLNMK